MSGDHSPFVTLANARVFVLERSGSVMDAVVVQRRGRTMWAAIGAAVAVAVGAGGVVHYVEADNVAAVPQSTYVAISPCRLIDTRADTTVGPRSTPLIGATAASWSVWGANGNCNIPSDATAVTMNVTIVNPTAAGYLSVWPSDQAQPTASSLNWVAGQAATPNAVTVSLSAAGQISTFNNAGNVDIIVDVAGYFTAAQGTSIWQTEYAAARYVFTNTGCGPAAVRMAVETSWGAPGAFPDLPCVPLPVWQQQTDPGAGMLEWTALLPARPAWVNLGSEGGARLIDQPTMPSVPGVIGAQPSMSCNVVERPQGDSMACNMFVFTSFPFDSSTLLAYSGVLKSSIVILAGQRT